MNRTVLIMLALAGVLLVTSSTDAQAAGDPECVQAQVWHLQQAMKSGLENEQGFHLGAGLAAEKLAATGVQGACGDWEGWARGEGAAASDKETALTMEATR